MTVLTNGRIHMLDDAGTVVDTLVIRDGRVAFAGRRGDVNVPVGEATLNLAGRAVLPGLVDAHGHLMYLARGRLTLDAGGVASEEAIAELVAAAAAKARRGEWISGRGWDQNLWPGRQFPSRASLDRAAPDNPVALVRIDGHATWANTAALHEAGITRETADPTGGIVVKDARGELTGLLIDTAQRLVQRAEPLPSEARFDQAVREAIAECLAAGLTGLHEMGVTLFALGALGVLPSMQATHCTSDMAWAVERLGPERLKGAYAWRSLLGTGVIIAGGSDFPVESPNPFHGIYAAVARRPRSGEDRGWQPEQRMTREEAARSFTTWNAYASHQEGDLGALTPGMRADLIVCSDDVFGCPEERIKDIHPVLTMMGGEIVHRRAEGEA